MATDMSLVVGDLDITTLSDEELYERLTGLGAVVGPIVGTTRKTYERKLAVLMGGKVANYSFTDPPANDADEPDDEPSQAYIELVSGNTARRRKPQLVTRPAEDYREDDEDDYEEEEMEEIHTSSRLYTSSSASPKSYTEKSPNERQYLQSQPSPLPSPFRKCEVEEQEGPEQQQRTPAAGGSGSMVFMVLTVLILAVLMYYFFLARSEKDAFARLENLAKKAAEQHQGAGSRQGL